MRGIWKCPSQLGLRREGTRIAHARPAISDLVTREGTFVPQLTQEYVIEGKGLYKTAAGNAIDQDIAEDRQRYMAELEVIREKHERAREAYDREASTQLKVRYHQVEAKLRAESDEMDQLHTMRHEAQGQENVPDSMFLRPQKTEDTAAKAQKRRVREKRVIRWVARCVAIGLTVTATVLTGFAGVEAGLSLIAAVESFCMAQKELEAKRKVAKSHTDER